MIAASGQSEQPKRLPAPLSRAVRAPAREGLRQRRIYLARRVFGVLKKGRSASYLSGVF